MPSEVQVMQKTGPTPRAAAPVAEPCLLVIFGASGDLTKRLLMPALFNLACDGLLPDRFAIVGIAMDEMTTEQFRGRMSEDIRKFNTRKTFDESAWCKFVEMLHYTPGKFDDPRAYERLSAVVTGLDTELGVGGNVIFYMATPPSIFGMISDHLDKAGFKEKPRGWTRIIVEKPFGHDLESAIELNKQLLAHWREDQIYRIDHYLGKETVQNLLAFRFSNGMFEPLWSNRHIDHIQFSVEETVGVEGRGKYYDTSGVLRDMIQNHMFQMLAYLCMEPPSSFKPDAIRNEKSKLLDAVRVMTPEEVEMYTVRGQYGPGKKPDGSPAVGYRQEPDVDPESRTETFAAAELYIDNWRWNGVPIYLRSGKALWKRGTEIVVQFKKAPEVIFRGTPVDHLASNTLIFHIQPDQGIEIRFQAKTPGPMMHLQPVNMRFNYGDTFEASRGTGYEVLLFNCMIGDATLFSRTDLVETAWRVAQPILDAWAASPMGESSSYPAGSWGPKAAFDLMDRSGRHWMEILNRDILARIPLFQAADAICLHNFAMSLEPQYFAPGQDIIRAGEIGEEMYFVVRGQVDVLDSSGAQVATLGEGEYFGELSLLSSKPRSATIRAAVPCNVFVLSRQDFARVVHDHPHFAAELKELARKRYQLTDADF
ncbi:glucose-6-phosphate dehydrogenase [Tundrisphaera lichenicola]|uniref:glucose-6-phosphate dehydrogenase n=1 Tax=Tundrisphaera lichenicola TaxID=2029860 RepID=UPI003EBDE669